jgi:hypothetical protein
MATAYNLQSDAKGMPAWFHYLRIRLKTEQYHLLHWAEVVNLTEQNESLSTTLQLNEGLVQEVLHQQEAILTGFWKVGHPYRFLLDDSKGGYRSDAAGELEFHERFLHAKSSLEPRPSGAWKSCDVIQRVYAGRSIKSALRPPWHNWARSTMP